MTGASGTQVRRVTAEAARPGVILRNAISEDGLWCSFHAQGRKNLEVTDERIFQMQAHGPLSPALLRVGGSAGRPRHARPSMRIRSAAKRGVLILVLALSILAALAWPSHGTAHPGHRHAVVAMRGMPRIWML